MPTSKAPKQKKSATKRGPDGCPVPGGCGTCVAKLRLGQGLTGKLTKRELAIAATYCWACERCHEPQCAGNDPWVMLKEAQRWIAVYAEACVGAQEMVDRIAECRSKRPMSGAELAEKFGFEPHGLDPLRALGRAGGR